MSMAVRGAPARAEGAARVRARRRGGKKRRRQAVTRSSALEATEGVEATGELSAGLEAPIQLVYLGTLLALLGGAAFLIARQVLIRRELDLAAKALSEKARENAASPEELYELGCVLLRKRAYTQALRYLEGAQSEWDAGDGELAQVDNAAGYAYLQLRRPGPATRNFESAVQRQPGYVTALNNWGDALERAGSPEDALEKFSEAASYDPTNSIATASAPVLSPLASSSFSCLEHGFRCPSHFLVVSAEIRDLRNRLPRSPPS